jgi:hypothetical protein
VIPINLIQKAFYIVFIVVHFNSQAQEVRIRLEKCTLEKKTLDEIEHSFIFQLHFYAQVFNDTTINSFRARIFGTKEEFVKYGKTKIDYNPNKTHAIAFYSTSLKEMVLHKEKIDDFSKVFAHELSHAILHYYCKDADIWLDEGLAEFLEDIVYRDSKYFFGVDQGKKIGTQSFLYSGNSIDQPVNAYNFYNYESPKNYTLSWALIHYLFQAKYELLTKIIRDNRGAGSVGSDILDRNYPGGIEVLKTDAKAFYLNFNPNSN